MWAGPCHEDWGTLLGPLCSAWGGLGRPPRRRGSQPQNMAVRGALECEDRTQYLECWGKECSLDLRAVGSRKHLGNGKKVGLMGQWFKGEMRVCGVPCFFSCE